MSTCARDCILADNRGLLTAARFRADSATSRIFVAEVTARGERQGDLRIELVTSHGLLGPDGSNINVIVEVEGLPAKEFSFAALSQGVTVHHFAAASTVRVRYSLARTIKAVEKGEFALVQHLIGGTVVKSHRPWIGREQAMTFATASTAECYVREGPTSTVCDLTVTIAPYAPGDPEYGVGGAFQSQQGNGASQPITVTFSKPVRYVRVAIHDPTFPGNRMIARSANGSQTVDFGRILSSPHPYDVKTITIVAGIQSVELIPAPGDYVAYSLAFGYTDCPPTGDPVFDLTEFKDQAAYLLQDADKSIPPAEREERALKVFLNKMTGVIRLEVDPHPGYCFGIPVSNRDRVSVPPGDSLVGYVHSHVFFRGEDVSGCNPRFTAPYDPGWFGGGSEQDWLFLTAPGNQFDVWVVTPDGMYYLSPNLTNKLEQLRNPARYKNRNGCAVR